MYSAVYRKLWQEVGGRIWTYFIVIVTFTLLLGVELGLPFYIILAMVLLTDLSVQIAGDDVRYGTFEFIFTRAINRRAYFTSRFLFGLTVLVALMTAATLMEWLELRTFFWSLISELGSIPVGAQVDSPLGMPFIFLPAMVLVYSVIYFLCSTTSQESRLSGNALGGWVISGIYTFGVTYLAEMICRGGKGERDSFLEQLSEVPFFMTLTGFLLLPVGLVFIIGREHYGRCSLPRSVQSDKQGSSWILWLVVILVAILVLASLYLTASTRVESTGG